MPKILFIEPNGTYREVDARVGESAMQAAVRHGVNGIIGECGGSCICATCHCHVDRAWTLRAGQPNAIEADTLELEARDVQATSRLACQINVTDALDGLVLRVVGGH